MPAQMRIDQVTPGVGVAGRSRHDLVPNEIITLTATSPAPGVGVSYTWEIIDKRGSDALLSATTGTSVSIGINTEIVSPCSFLVQMTANDNGVITRTRRIASVRTTVAGLRMPVFPETAPDANTFDLNDPDLSTDNALYSNRSGLGSSQNWSGWAEWAWELTMAVEAASGSGPPSGAAGGDLGSTYPNPSVLRIRGRQVHTTVPADGNVYYWDDSNTRWDAADALGDVTGGWRALVVGKLQGRDVSAAAPDDGDVLTWNAGGSTWEPAEPAASSGTLVFRPGGVASGNVFTTWAALYAEAQLVQGPVIVSIDDSAGAPQIPAGSYDLQDWTIQGEYDSAGARPDLTILTGVTITGNFILSRIKVTLDAGATSPIAVGALAYLVELIDADLLGGSGSGIFSLNGAGALFLILRGVSRAQATAIVLNSGSVTVDLYDRSRVSNGGIAGTAGTLTIRDLSDNTAIFGVQSGFSGTTIILTPKEEMNGPLNEENLGTTELHIGSLYLLTGTRILSASAAMLGASDPADTGILRMRRFTGGTLVATWTNVGTLDDTALGADVSIANTDWYDLYLVGGAADETAIIKGLRLLSVKE